MKAATEAEVASLLMERYEAPRYVVVPQVANGTGRKRSRTVDAVVFEMWPMDGLGIIGIEVKSARSDWLREAKHPPKADAIRQHCDEWYVAAGAPGIVRLGELPLGVGLFEVADGKITCLRKAVRREGAGALDRAFVMVAVRGAARCSPHGAEIKRRVKEEVAQRAERIRYDAEIALRQRMDVERERHREAEAEGRAAIEELRRLRRETEW